MAYEKKSKRLIRVEGDIAFVPLTLGKEAIVDADKVHLLEKWNWYAEFNKLARKYYALRSTRIKGKKQYVRMHHVIAGNVPAGFVPHHLDGDGLNNRSSNLEIITSLNNFTLAGKKTAKNAGVNSRKAVLRRNELGRKCTVRYVKRYNSWSVQIGLGQYQTEEEAQKIKKWADSVFESSRTSSK